MPQQLCPCIPPKLRKGEVGMADEKEPNTLVLKLREEIEAARRSLQRVSKQQETRIIVPDEFASVYKNHSSAQEAVRYTPSPPPRGFRLWFAIWNLSFLKEVRSERLGLFWWFAEPFMLIMVFTIMALVFFGGSVAGMPSFPFAIIGVTLFLTFRTTFMTSAVGAGALAHCLSDPSISRFDMMFGQSPRALVANAAVGGGLLGFLVWRGDIPLPERPAEIVLCLFCCGIIGFAFGLWASLMNFLYTGFRRIYPIIVRLFTITSGLFYVSEQLPPQFKVYVLWNPMLHAGQLSRDAWFTVYETTDASFAYLLGVTLVCAGLGLSFAIMERRRRAEAGDVE